MSTHVSLIQNLRSGLNDGSAVAWDQTKSVFTINPVMTDETARDSANNLKVSGLASFDNGLTYQVVIGPGEWVGNPADDPRNPGSPAFPVIGTTFTLNKPHFVMARLEIGEGVTMSVGCNISQQ